MKIKKTTFGYKISFDCPKCKLGLVAKLEEAGSTDQCPNCSTRFKVPGQKQLEAMRSREAESKAQRKEERRIKAEEKLAQKAERKAEKEQARKQIEKSAYELAEQKELEETNSEGVEREASAHLSQGGIADPFDPFTKLMSMYTSAQPANGSYAAASVKCQQCGSLMFEETKVTNDMTAQLGGVAGCLFGVILLAIGFLLFITFGQSGIGFLVAPLLAIAGLAVVAASSRVGHSKKKIMACNNCGYFFERL